MRSQSNKQTKADGKLEVFDIATCDYCSREIKLKTAVYSIDDVT